MGVGDYKPDLAQTLVHEKAHCFLSARDRRYRWDVCVNHAQEHGDDSDLLENADSISGVVLFLWCLLYRPQWDFSTGYAKLRAGTPRWVKQLNQNKRPEDATMINTSQIEPKVMHLRNRDVIWAT
jgi:hypothetical protein